MKQAILAASAVLLSMSAQAEPFGGTPPRRPFVATLSNNTPLAFGMDAEQTARALGSLCNMCAGVPATKSISRFATSAAAD